MFKMQQTKYYYNCPEFIPFVIPFNHKLIIFCCSYFDLDIGLRKHFSFFSINDLIQNGNPSIMTKINDAISYKPPSVHKFKTTYKYKFID